MCIRTVTTLYNTTLYNTVYNNSNNIIYNTITTLYNVDF